MVLDRAVDLPFSLTTVSESSLLLLLMLLRELGFDEFVSPPPPTIDSSTPLTSDFREQPDSLNMKIYIELIIS